MPFINGRYYINPVMGEALEAAREAEAALAALEKHPQQNAGAASGTMDDPDVDPHAGQDGPIHRVEIEAAEVVPAHSGRAAQGYVARLHRQPANVAATASTDRGRVDSPAAGKGAETHVFADHRDLLGFLRNELAKDAHSRAAR